MRRVVAGVATYPCARGDVNVSRDVKNLHQPCSSGSA